MGAYPAKTLSLSDRAALAGRQALAGGGGGLRHLLPFAGPAIIASVAYVDPGNYATNIQAGARYGYELLWVVVIANLIAMLFQALSAKVGIVTGSNLAELCRAHFSRPVVWGMWVVSEIAAMATDLAEFLGGAIGFSLLLHLPLLAGMVVTGIVSYALLSLQGSGFRPLELAIAILVGIIGATYLAEIVIAPPDWGQAALHAVVPHLADSGAAILAVGIVGATVMPHAIYLHSGLTQDRIVPRNDAERRRLLGFSNREVVVALGVAGLINLAMVMVAATVFHDGVHDGVAEIDTAYNTLVPLLGSAAAAIFLVSLIASGLSSSAVGTMAGQLIMQGFVGFRMPIAVRRLTTMIPSFVVVALGVDATRALIGSQVVLSLVLPVPMIALLVLSGRTRVMGIFVNSRLTAVTATGAAILVLGLNGVLVAQAVGLAW